MNIRVDFLDSEETRCLELSAQSLLSEMQKPQPQGREWSIRDIVWPVYDTARGIDPELVLVPLERVGAQQGFGGSHVMIGYFVAKNPAKLTPSLPMVVKVSHKTRHQALDDERKNANAVRPYVMYYKDSFASPIHYDYFPDENRAILWSPFSSAGSLLKHVEQSANLDLTFRDFWSLLRSGYSQSDPNGDRMPNCLEALLKIYEWLVPLHQRGGQAVAKNRSFGDEYKWYLRDFSETTGWGGTLAQGWIGNTVSEFGFEFANPLKVMDALCTHEAELFCGAVHGDLHPRNIVFSSSDVPHIIDFGWAQDDAHIAKDFVLMECNLRFVAFRPDIPWSDMVTLCNWIDFDEDPPTFISQECTDQANLVYALRQQAKSHFPSGSDWQFEYIVPLFLTAFGLLRVLASSDNQMMSRLMVLTLASHLQDKLSLVITSP